MSKVIVIGDAYVAAETLVDAVKAMKLPQPIEITVFNWQENLSKTAFQEMITAIETEGPEKFPVAPEIMAALGDAEYLFVHFAPVSTKMIAAAPNLKLIGTCRGGVEHLAVAAAKEKNIPILHVIRNAEPVADFTLGLMYAVTRNIALSHAAVMEGKWLKNYPNDPYRTTLNQQTVALIGLGHVGKLVAKKLNALGVPVIVYDPFVSAENLEKNGLKVTLVDLETAFKTADIISLHLRVTPETENIINQDLLALMKPSSYLINTARPAILNQADLLAVLQQKAIAGAALDVVWEEPLVADSPLLKLDNLTITSHIAGDTVDAIPKSPYLLKDVFNDYVEKGIEDMLI